MPSPSRFAGPTLSHAAGEGASAVSTSRSLSRGAEEGQGEGHFTTTGRIGPNAVTRLAEALAARDGPDLCGAVFAAAGLAHHLADPPRAMVDEADVAALHRALFGTLGAEEAAEVAWEAGRLTGLYLLAHRIPRPAQAILRRLPRPLASRILLKAIARHAWTFAGSGTFAYGFDPGLWLRLEGSPVCRAIRTEAPACHYFAGTFETVLGAMLGPRTRVVETDCAAAGAAACVFRVGW
jgi:divinyl protochlorophyllide a 8-vinyl-reductase